MHHILLENVIILSEGTGTYSGMMQMAIPHAACFEYGRLLHMDEAKQRLEADIESILNKQPTGIKARHFAFWGDLSSEFRGTSHIDNFVPLTDAQRQLFGITESNIYPTMIDGYPPEEKWAALLKEL